MAELLFRRGLLTDLFHQTDGVYDKAPLIDGALSFTTDEPAIYMDTATGRERIGDIKTFANAQEFLTYINAHTDYLPTTALYYIVGTSQDSTNANDKIGEIVYYNALLKWTGTTWIQINEKSNYSGELSQLQDDVNAAATAAGAAQAAANKAQTEVDALEKLHADDKTELAGDIKEVSDALNTHKTAYATKIAALEEADSNTSNALSAHINTFNTTVEGLNTAIGNKQATITGAASTVTTNDLTANTVVIANDQGKLAASSISTTKLGYLTDVTSNIQDQLNAITSDINGINTSIGNLNTAIGTAKTEAIATAKTETENQIKALVGDAATDYNTLKKLEDKIKANAKSISDNKTAQDTVNDGFTNDINGINTEIGNLKAADTQIGKDITAAKEAAIAAAAADATKKADAVRGNTSETVASVDSKVSALTETVNSNYNSLSTLIGNADTKIDSTATTLRGEFAAADEAQTTTITTAYQNYVNDKLKVADAMRFKGVVNVLTDLPQTAVEAGWTYKVGANIKVSDALTLYVGDLLIANADQTSDTYPRVIGTTGETWSHISSGYEDDHDVHIEKSASDDKILLKNAAAQNRGSILIEGSTGSNLKVTVNESAKDAQSGVTDVKVTLAMEWGTF